MPKTQKVSLRQIGSSALVEYEVGKTYSSGENGIKFLVGSKNKLVSIPANKNFVCENDSTISIVGA